MPRTFPIVSRGKKADIQTTHSLRTEEGTAQRRPPAIIGFGVRTEPGQTETLTLASVLPSLFSPFFWREKRMGMSRK